MAPVTVVTLYATIKCLIHFEIEGNDRLKTSDAVFIAFFFQNKEIFPAKDYADE